MIKIFVYGTLMKDRYNHDRYLKEQRYLGQAVLPGYALFDLGSFPGIIPDVDEKVLGELYEIDSKALERLDILEDNGRLYNRETVEVWQGNTKNTACVYVWNAQVHLKNKVEFSDQPWNKL